MGSKRTLVVFLAAAGLALTVSIVKALVFSGLSTLPPVRLLIFAASMFGLLAAFLDWALLRQVLRSGGMKSQTAGTREDRPQHVVATVPPETHDPVIIQRARRQTIVFREICPPPAVIGLS